MQEKYILIDLENNTNHKFETFTKIAKELNLELTNIKNIYKYSNETKMTNPNTTKKFKHKLTQKLLLKYKIIDNDELYNNFKDV